MSSFIKGKQRKARLNKKKMSEQVDKAKQHDGQNWSLLATAREIGQTEEEMFYYFGLLVEKEFTEANGYEGKSFGGHTVFTKMIDDKPFECYIRPIGTPKKEGGMDFWDFHINNNVKELYLEYLKTIVNAEKKEV